MESVSWISAFQDPLAALFLLGSLALVLGRPAPPRGGRAAAALTLFVLGLLSKEVSITFPALIFAAVAARDRSSGSSRRDSLGKAFATTAPFLLAAAAYLAARKAILGVFLSASSTAPFSAALLTLPRQFVFYLGQSVFPAAVGPVHPIRPVLPGGAGPAEFWGPLALSAAALAGLFLLARRSPLRLVGLALFLFLLVPSLPASNLPADRIVQDRYLYLPLLGLLMVLLPALADGMSRLASIGPGNADRAVLVLAAAASLPLGLATARYAQAWRSDASLWEWGVGTDPGSPLALGQHATWLYRAGRTAEARAFADRALRIDPVRRDALLVRARLEESARQLDDAERDYRLNVKVAPDLAEGWEEIAGFYRRNGQPEEALRLLRIGRDRLPFTRAAFTDNLASILHDLGRTEEALRELETVRPIVRNEFHPASPSVLFHIGLMNLELGRTDRARIALAEFLDASARADDPEIVRRRGEAAEILGRLSRALPAPDAASAGALTPSSPR